MSTKQDIIRNKLTDKVFTPYGKSVTLKSKNSPSYNDRGEEENTSYTETTITVVPYNIVDERESFSEGGTAIESEMEAAVPYTTTVNQGDILTIESVDYEVKEVEKNYLPDNVVTIVRLVKVQA